MCLSYCHIAYISPGSCKDCVKEPPSLPPPLSSSFLTCPLPLRDYTFALWASGHRISFFSRSLFNPALQKRLWFFGNNVSGIKLQGFLILQRGLIMLSFSETFFLKTTRPIALISLRGHDCLNCRHLPNVCKFLLDLEAQILDTAFSSGGEKCRSKTFSIFSILGLHFVPLPPSIIISSSIQCYLFYVFNWYKKSYFIQSFQ